MKPRKEVLALVGAVVVLAGVGYWYGTGDDTPPTNIVVQNVPPITREHKPLVKGQHVRRRQAAVNDEAEPETPRRNPATVTERPRNVRKAEEKGTAKKDDRPAV